MESVHQTRRKMKEDQAPRKENTDPVVSRVTTFKLGGVWRPKDQQSSEDEASREKKRRAKMEEKWWNSRGYKFFIKTFVILSPNLFLCLGRKWVVCSYVKWTNVFALGIRALKNPNCNTFFLVHFLEIAQALISYSLLLS